MPHSLQLDERAYEGDKPEETPPPSPIVKDGPAAKKLMEYFSKKAKFVAGHKSYFVDESNTERWESILSLYYMGFVDEDGPGPSQGTRPCYR